MIEFLKYDSIENHHNKKVMADIVDFYGDGEYVATEKIHGSNFSIWYDGTDIKYAKRTGYVEEGENFFNYKIAVNNQMLEMKIKRIYDTLKRLFKKDMTIIIYGELFGGKYNHTSVSYVKGVGAIQKGVSYTPNIAFACFDISIDGEYLNYDFFKRICKSNELVMVPEIFRGTLAECLEQDNALNSVVYKEFGLPEIKDNVAEGLVIKPVIGKRMRNGARVIIKSKNEKFAENKQEPKKPIDKDIILNDMEFAVYCLLLRSCTLNRLDNVVSKIGKIRRGDFNLLMGLFIRDCIEEYLKNPAAEPFKSKDGFDTKKINKHFQKFVSNFIRNTFLILCEE